MKNIFKLSTGIVLLFTIMLALGCTSKNTDPGGKKVVEVKIYISSFVDNGKVHLNIRDSNDSSAVDTLSTWINPGDRIIWDLDTNSGIKKIRKIKGTNRKIFHKNPGNFLKNKPLILDTKENIEKGVWEKYDIIFRLEKNGKKIIDPYIRVRPS